MTAIRGLSYVVIVGVLSNYGWAEDKKPNYAKLIVGKWEVTKSEKELPVGTVIEFTKDDKMKFAIKNKNGQPVSYEATYKIVGDQLEFTLLGDRAEKKDPLTIKDISEDNLVLFVPQKNRTWVFKRIK